MSRQAQLQGNQLLANPMTTPAKQERFTVSLSVELTDRIRNAVYWTLGLTLVELTETALMQSLDQLKTQRGQPFPPRQSELKAGRPIR